MGFKFMTPMNHFQLDIFATMRQSEKEEKLGREILSFLYLSFLDCSAVYFLPRPNSVWVRSKIFNVRIFYLCNPFTRNGPNAFTDCSIVYTSPYILLIGTKACTLSRVPCKRKAEPCKLLFVPKFVRTRVNGI